MKEIINEIWNMPKDALMNAVTDGVIRIGVIFGAILALVILTVAVKEWRNSR